MSTDSDIIRRARENPRAFAELYDEHARAITLFAIKRVGQDAADDVVSETFLIAFRRLRSFDDSFQSALPWLFGIAARVIHKHHRAEAKQWRALAAAGGLPTVRQAETEDADRRADAERASRALAPLIAKLPKRDRDTLLLYAWGDLTYEQVAAALGVPVGTVRSRLNRLRRILSTASASFTEPAAAPLGGRS